MMPRFDSACVSPLNQSHGDTDEEKHLSLLHAEEKKIIKKLLYLEQVSP